VVAGEPGAAASASAAQPAEVPVSSLEAPATMKCLERYYAGHTERRGAALWLAFGAEKAIPEHDGRVRSFDERLAAPDVQDVFTPRYRRGPLVAVTEKDFDPGRARPALLFQETYGATAAAVGGALVPVRLVAGTISVHRRAAEPLRKVAARLTALVATHPEWVSLFDPLGGGFNFRNVAGTEQLSAHAFGVAVDLNPKYGAYWRWTKAFSNRIPAEIVAAFESEGFIWGGRWYHFDTMHFEYRPELLDESCYNEGEDSRKGP
jgi:PAS domain-containing protein